MTARLVMAVTVKCNGLACSVESDGVRIVGTGGTGGVIDLIDAFELARRELRKLGWSSPAAGVTAWDFCPECTAGRPPAGAVQ